MTAEIWTKYARLLKEAVVHKSYHAVRKLLENESVIPSADEFKENNNIPLCLAIEQKNIPIINLFRKFKYDLPEPHKIDCSCKTCLQDEYGQAKYHIILLRALSNPIWISLTAEDQFLTAFKLCKLNRKFKNSTDCFKDEYDNIYENLQKYSCNLLDEVRTNREGATLMRCKTISRKSDCRQLDFINVSIEYGQKEVIAHSLTQHFLTSAVFGEIPNWKVSGVTYKLFVTIILGMIYPFTTLLNIFVPPFSITASVSQFAMKPFVKFVNGAFSFITFLLLLTFLGAIDRNGIRLSEAPSGLEIAVFVWLLGFCFAECKQLYNNGIKGYFSSGWNWVDVGMDVLMLFSFIAWAVLYYHTPERSPKTREAYQTTMYVADFSFTVSIILSFFRVIYLCQITRYLGLIQMCLGEMIMVLIQFAFLCTVVLMSFSVGMVYLFNSSHRGMAQKNVYRQKYKNETAIYSTFEESFYGFFSTAFTMVYVSLTMEGTETLKDFHDGTLVQLWANLLFIVYFGITMIVVLNMLIAMMNQSYQRIVDNMDVWFLNSRTQLWMEYVGSEHTRPVPFNLIPSIKDLIEAVKKIRKLCMKCCNREQNLEVERMEQEEKKQYRDLCETLVKRYLRTKFGCCGFADPPDDLNEEDQKADHLLLKIQNHLEQWKKTFIIDLSEGLEMTSFPAIEEDEKEDRRSECSHISSCCSHTKPTQKEENKQVVNDGNVYFVEDIEVSVK